MNLQLNRLNPVLDRELRQRSRSMRSMILLTLFLGLLIAVMFLAYKGSEVNNSNNFNFDPVAALNLRVGRTMFEWVLAAELVILLFIVPGISAGAIAGERDRQTLVPLQVTLVGPVRIFIGKVLASSSFLLLLLVGSAPILAVPYLIGGISLSNVLLSLFVLLCVGFLLAVIGVACSSIFRRTQTATLATYGIVLGLTLGTAVLLVVLAVIDSTRGTDDVEPRTVALWANPFLAVADAAGDIDARSDGPFSPIKQVIFEAEVGSNVELIEEPGFDGPIAIDVRNGQQIEIDIGEPTVPLWVRSLLTQAAIASILAFFGIRRLRAPQKELRN